jgi:hypothetical protein
MEKLILVFTEGDGYTYSYDKVNAFEYASKDQFVFDILEKYKDFDWSTKYSFPKEVEILPGVFLGKYEVERIEHDVYTLEEWFEQNKISEKQIYIK